MSRKKLHMKIKRIFCGVLAAGMLLGQTGAVWAEATDTPANDTAASSPTPTPDPHTEYYAQEADTDSIQGWPVGPKIEAQAAVLMDLNTEAVLYSRMPTPSFTQPALPNFSLVFSAVRIWI